MKLHNNITHTIDDFTSAPGNGAIWNQSTLVVAKTIFILFRAPICITLTRS